jgi:hypothetical protein
MFLGYPDSHSSDVYHMWNLKTERVVKSRDVLWLNKSYKQYYNSGSANDDDDDDLPLDTPDLDAGRVTEKAVAPDLSIEEETVVEDSNEPDTEPDTEPGSEEAEAPPILSIWQLREMRQLGRFFNPEAQQAVQSIDQVATRSMQSGLSSITTGDTVTVPE